VDSQLRGNVAVKQLRIANQPLSALLTEDVARKERRAGLTERSDSAAMTGPIATLTGRWRRVARPAAVLALIWCLPVLLAHVAAGQFSCGQDTSSCATNSQKNTVFEGQLPMVNTSFQVVFEGAGLVGGFRTDPVGHYCILWGPDGAAGDIVINGRESSILGSGTPLRVFRPLGADPATRAVEPTVICSTSLKRC
jgi:hypothetical protein